MISSQNEASASSQDFSQEPQHHEAKRPEFIIEDDEQRAGNNLYKTVTVRTEDPYAANVAAITGYKQASKSGFVWPVMKMQRWGLTVQTEDTLALPGKIISSQEEYDEFTRQFPIGTVLRFERTTKEERGMTVVKIGSVVREATTVSGDNESIKAYNVEIKP